MKHWFGARAAFAAARTIAGLVLVALFVTGCIRTEQQLVVRPSDTLDEKDYSGAYSSFVLLDGDEPDGGRRRTEDTYYFQRVGRGLYQIAWRPDSKTPAKFSGFLTVLDVGTDSQALLAINVPGEPGTMMLLARENRNGGIDVFVMAQDDAEKLDRLAALAGRFGLTADTRGVIAGEPDAATLRKAFVDPAFLSNINLQLIGAFNRMKREKAWPDVVVYDNSGDAPGDGSKPREPKKPATLTGLPSHSWNLVPRESRGATSVCVATHGDTGLRVERYRTATRVPVKGFVVDNILSAPVPIATIKQLARPTPGDNYDRQNIESQVADVDFGLNLDFHIPLQIRQDGGWYALDWFLTKSPGYRESAVDGTVLVSVKVNDKFLANLAQESELVIGFGESGRPGDILVGTQFNDLHTAVVNLDRCLAE